MNSKQPIPADPPAYTETPDAAPPPPPSSSHTRQPSTADAEPPTYTDVHSSSAKDQLSATGDLLTLILDGATIIPADDLSKPLYQLNHQPLSGTRAIYRFEKVLYRLSANDGEGRIRQTSRHIYDFWSGFSSVVSVSGKGGSKTAYKEATISSLTGRWNSCTVQDHFSAERSLKQRFKRGGEDEIEWKDTKSHVLAVEHRGGEAPRLEMKRQIDGKDFDLLVACWMGRLFRESCREVDSQRPFSLNRVKNTALTHFSPVP